MDCTPKEVFFNRRQFIAGSVALGLLPNIGKSQPDTITAQSLVSAHCNYYEFSTTKSAIPQLASSLTIKPWMISIEGLVESPISFNVSALQKEFLTVNRIYPLRCVEGWVATIPWSGVLLSDVLRFAKPLREAKYIRFMGAYNPNEMIGQRRSNFNWPYEEGLTIEEGLHPLTLLATGMYDGPLTPQNGAPIRLVVPWKYGFKSIKALTRIELTDQMPVSTWRQKAPEEYGFYANVNPQVPHPRWGQRRELPLGELKKRRTKMFNGFEQEVAHLYQDMDLSENF